MLIICKYIFPGHLIRRITLSTLCIDLRLLDGAMRSVTVTAKAFVNLGLAWLVGDVVTHYPADLIYVWI